MASRWRSVIAPRGSSGPDHSGTWAGEWRSSNPSPTRSPTTACNIDFAMDQLNRRVVCRDGLGFPVEVLQRALIALGHYPTAMDDHHGMRRRQRPAVVAHAVEQGFEFIADFCGWITLRPLRRRPRHTFGLGWKRDQAYVVRHRPPVTQRRGGTARGRRWSRAASPVAPSGRRPRRGWCRGSRGARGPWSRPRPASWC